MSIRGLIYSPASPTIVNETGANDGIAGGTLVIESASAEAVTGNESVGSVGNMRWQLVKFVCYCSDTPITADYLNRVNSNTFHTVHEIIDIAYTPVLGDAEETITLSNAAAITVTIPHSSTVAYPLYTRIRLVQMDIGQVTVVGAGSVTLQNAASQYKIKGKWGTIWVQQISANVWVLVGDTTA